MSGISTGIGQGKLGASTVVSTATVGGTVLVASATNVNGLILRYAFAQFDAQYGNLNVTHPTYGTTMSLFTVSNGAAAPPQAHAWFGEMYLPPGYEISAHPRHTTPGLGEVIISYDLL